MASSQEKCRPARWLFSLLVKKARNTGLAVGMNT